MNLTFEQLPFVWQSETAICVEWWGERGLQTSYQQLEDDLKQEVLSIWQTGTYNQSNTNNVLRNLRSNNDRRGTVVVVFNRFVRYKSTGRFGDSIDEGYRGWGGRFVKTINGVYQKQLEAWTEKNQQLQIENERLKQQLQEHQNCATDKQNLQNQINQLQQQNTQNQQTIASLNQTLAQVNSTNSQLQTQITNLNQQISDKDNQITSLNNQIREKDKQISELKGENDKLESESQRLTELLSKSETQIETLKAQEQQCQTDKTSLQQELDKTQELLVTNQQKLENSGLGAIYELETRIAVSPK